MENMKSTLKQQSLDLKVETHIKFLVVMGK